jgi:hypothetical protein
MLKIGDTVRVNRPASDYKGNPTWVENAMARFVGKEGLVVSEFKMWDDSDAVYIAFDGTDSGFTFSPKWLTPTKPEGIVEVRRGRGRPKGIIEAKPRAKKSGRAIIPKSEPNYSALKTKDILAVAKQNSKIVDRSTKFSKEIIELAKAYARHEVTLRGVSVALEMDDANARHFMLKVWEEIIKNLK